MSPIKTITALVFMFFTIQLPIQAAGKQVMSQIEIAKQYYLALYSGDHDQVRKFASSEMVFEDPSAPQEYGIPPLLQDLKSFLSFMQGNLQGETNIKFTDSFISNDRVVLMLKTTGTIPAASVGMDEEGMVKFQSRGVSVLHIADDKVVRHTDYFDYPGLSKTFRKIEK